MNIPFEDILSVAGGFFILVDIVLAALFVFISIKALSFRPRFSPSVSLERKRGFVFHDPQLKERWHKLVVRAETNPPQSYTLALIEADAFVDDVLKRLDVEGEHMADRLEKLTPEDFKSLDGLWRAHRIRNQLAHSPDLRFNRVDAWEALGAYEGFLKEIGVL